MYFRQSIQITGNCRIKSGRMINCLQKHDNFRFFRDRNVCYMEISTNDNGNHTVSVCPNNNICHYWDNHYKEKIDNGNFGLLRR